MPFLRRSDLLKRANKVLSELSTRYRDLEFIPDFLHLSFNGTLEGVWQPRQPYGMELDKQGQFPEPEFDRISFSTTIVKAFWAIYPNISHFFEEKNYPHMDMYTYIPRFNGKERIITTNVLQEQRYVWDAHLTEENWCIDPVYMRLGRKVRIYQPEDNSEVTAAPFGDFQLAERFVGPEVVDWEYID